VDGGVDTATSTDSAAAGTSTDNGNMIFIFDRKTKNEWLSLLILNRTL
jgi:hypothetical protein